MVELKLTDVNAPNFREARDQAQNVAQWLARMTRSFAVSHPPSCELFWISQTQTICTPEIAPGIVLELRLPELRLQFSEGGCLVPHPLDIEGKSSAEVEAWLRAEMLHRGFDRDRFSIALPYEWSKLMAGDEKKYCPESLENELRLLTHWFQNASTILLQVRNRLQGALKGDAHFMIAADTSARLNCRPEKLAIGFVIKAKKLRGGSPSITIAFMAGDDDGAEPHFLVASESAASAILPANAIESTLAAEDTVGYLIARAYEQMAAIADSKSL